MSASDDRARAEAMVSMAVGDRIESAGEPPGIRQAVIDGVLDRFQSISDRLRMQLDHLRSGSSTRIPDAYFLDEQESEHELQKAAAGIRAAAALAGYAVEAAEFERGFASDLAPVGIWSRLDEASRVPRPKTRPSVLGWSLEEVPWLENSDASSWPPPEQLALNGTRQLTGDDSEIVRVEEAPYTGWAQIGFVERQRTLRTRHPDVPARQLFLMSGIEIGDRPEGSNVAPLSEGPPDLWTHPFTDLDAGLDDAIARSAISTGAGPLSALVRYERSEGAPSAHRGLGLHEFCLSPRIEVVAILGLRPELPNVRHVMIDEHGPGIVCRQWRSLLIHAGDYGPLVPAIVGSDLILRPDLFDALAERVGRDRLRLGLYTSHSVASNA